MGIKWANWMREFSNRLQKTGYSFGVIQGISLFSIEDSQPMRVRSIFGMIANSPETLGFALSRWLNEHEAEEGTPRYVENIERLNEIISMTGLPETLTDSTEEFSLFQKGSEEERNYKLILYINELVDDHFDSSAEELYKIADKNIIGKFSYADFSNYVDGMRTPMA